MGTSLGLKARLSQSPPGSGKTASNPPKEGSQQHYRVVTRVFASCSGVLFLLGTVARAQKVKLRNTNFQSSWAKQNSAAFPGFRACIGPGTGSPRLAPASALQDHGRSPPCSAPPLHHSRKKQLARTSQQLGACPRILLCSDPPQPDPSRLEANLCSPRLSSDPLLPIWH